MKTNIKSPQWRQRFIELSEGIFRELGFAPPPMLHEESLPLAMELEIDKTPFEILHSSSNLNDRVLVICKLGNMPASNEDYGLQMLMKENLNNMRMHAEWYGLSAETREICLMCHKSLNNITPQKILHDMKKMIADSGNWESRFFDPLNRRLAIPTDLQKPFLA